MTKDEFKEIICDEYCSFIHILNNDALDEKCENCILNELENLED